MYGFPARNWKNLSSQIVVMGPGMMLFPPSVGHGNQLNAPSKLVWSSVAWIGSSMLGSAVTGSTALTGALN
jgi:hypothetical protein